MCSSATVRMKRAEEPVGDVDVRALALGDRAEEHDRVGDPDDAIRMSIGHSSSAYSLPCVIAERQRDRRGSTMTACQPQNVNAASLSQNSRTWQVRCTT